MLYFGNYGGTMKRFAIMTLMATILAIGFGCEKKPTWRFAMKWKKRWRKPID
jgi:hypothetical protein